MGLSIHGTKSLMYAKTQGVCFTRTATIGRQELHLSRDELRTNLSEFGYSEAADEVNDLMGKAGGFAEPFLEALGAIEICSFDSSDYEGANNIHDFNSPIDESFKHRFSAVIDGGTLEHVFNFPVAIKNCMEMVEVGGHFIGITPTNNFLGHGFYQFSPELFFRIFSEPNGFRIMRMIIFEGRPEAEWFEVADPDAIKERVSLVNSHQTNLLVLAEKVKAVQIFAAPPQQSDYVAQWKPSDKKTEAAVPSAPAPINGRDTGERLFSRVARRLYRFAPAPVKSLYRRMRDSRLNPLPSQPFSNHRFYRRLRIP
jgi:hypothetical protein